MASAAQVFRPGQRLLALLGDLRLAIGLLLLIALASALGTALPQNEPASAYHDHYDAQPWLGLLTATPILALRLDHVYSSGWFLALLALLATSLATCSIRRQWPALRSGLQWVDHQHPHQLSQYTVGLTREAGPQSLRNLAQLLRQNSWKVQQKPGRLSARQGVIASRSGPLLVHVGLIVLMTGAAWGVLGGQRLERFLAPGRTLDLVDRQGETRLSIQLQDFSVDRDARGQAQQFHSQLLFSSPAMAAARPVEISVNHPARMGGVTVYQADWQVAALTVQLGGSPRLQFPLQPLPSLGEQVWGVAIPTRPDGSHPVLLTVASEQGPVLVYDSNGEKLGALRVASPPLDVDGLPIRITHVLPASGLLIKQDPGVPLVYTGFAVVLLGGGLSVVASRKLWAVAAQGHLHVAGISNRNVVGFGEALPRLLDSLTDADHGEP
ncbi:MAG: cytochrome C biogenesis protein CcsB [Candidatus Synechococcus spongiarum SP3]|uniref:Cytochrome c biogenesis protein CcsB n=1 Tax=Candidatus Synechococcus spongiarum SP3 TaxID=1604020 RepID=A0A0G2HP93_9SYNE|nr:MAG: cytochrome C biogenesis protein CcsB [Candidatus Synechococcus spongiarum SP3]